MMWPDRRLVELFEIGHPIVLAPMAGFGTVELAAAVADAGGLGSIGCATMNPRLALETHRVRAASDQQVHQHQFLLSYSGEGGYGP